MSLGIYVRISTIGYHSSLVKNLSWPLSDWLLNGPEGTMQGEALPLYSGRHMQELNSRTREKNKVIHKEKRKKHGFGLIVLVL